MKNIKKWAVFFSFLLLLTTNYIFSRDITVGLYDNKPLTYYENNKFKGFIVDILNEIARKENWHVKYKYGEFGTLYNELKEGKIDILLDIAYSEKRTEFILFNKEPVFINWAVVYSFDKKLNSLLDLSRKTVAVIKSDIYYTGKEGIKVLAEQFHLSINFLEVDSYDDALKAVREKKAYAAILSRIYAGDTYGLFKTPIIFSPVEIHFGFSKDIDKGIIEKIDYYLGKWKADNNSIYYNLLDRYLLIGKKEIPYWIKLIIILSLVVIATVSMSLYVHKKALKKATEELREKNKKLRENNEQLLLISKELEELYKENEEFSTNLYRMINILSSMTPGKNLDEFYQNILETAIHIIPEADYGSILLIDTEKMKTKFIAAYGHDLKKLQQINSIVGTIPDKEDIRIVKDIINSEKRNDFPEKDYKILISASRPIKESLVNEIKIKSDTWIKILLDIDANSDKNFSEQSKKLVNGFGNLVRAFWLEKLSSQEIKNAYLKFAEKLSIIAEAHDDITGAHIYRVGQLSRFIAEKLKLPVEKIKEIEAFAPLHDIGKIFIDRELLRKNGRLTKEEFEEIKKHTVYGARLLEEPYFKTAKNIALYHHEKYNGKGYPHGLYRDEIPIEAQIVALADVYDALRSPRPYKEKYSHEKALKIILKGDNRTSPDDFNPEILKILERFHLEFQKIYDKFS
ncbi:transporter substrate-binding domain-containing protein [Thermosipho ferrireducens]|uniref:Transporter substrate-binding domain-containing protein n=1 Tax=Thermosipho ferrireducens TaxID=2571116 RepID=A0ABX7S4Q1_9BACT|nr:HD domain-containing phosphohydrolase [Thermosipho ferrireducens]QTA37451.1 transporter substrate-binding domain-containing protein [Thermosipho ferrireducens]